MSVRLQDAENRLDKLIIQLNHNQDVDMSATLNELNESTQEKDDTQKAEYIEGLHDYLVLRHVYGVEEVSFKSLLDNIHLHPESFLSHAGKGLHRDKPRFDEVNESEEVDVPVSQSDTENFTSQENPETEIQDEDTETTIDLSSGHLESETVTEESELAASTETEEPQSEAEASVVEDTIELSVDDNADTEDEIEEESKDDSSVQESEDNAEVADADSKESEEEAKNDSKVSSEITADIINNKEFTKVRKGYVDSEVDSALDSIHEIFVQFDGFTSEEKSKSISLIQEGITFKTKSLGKGYDQDEVDNFLDDIANALKSRI